MSYTIRQLMKEFGVTARTLRHYEAVGLLSPARAGLARLFSSRDRARLKLALLGRRVGFTLDEVRELFELYESAGTRAERLDAFLARLEDKRTALERQRDDVDAMLGEIRFFADHCARLKANVRGATQSGR